MQNMQPFTLVQASPHLCEIGNEYKSSNEQAFYLKCKNLSSFMHVTKYMLKIRLGSNYTSKAYSSEEDCLNPYMYNPQGLNTIDMGYLTHPLAHKNKKNEQIKREVYKALSDDS